MDLKQFFVKQNKPVLALLSEEDALELITEYRNNRIYAIEKAKEKKTAAKKKKEFNSAMADLNKLTEAERDTLLKFFKS
jgi:hypothetical protein